MARRRWERATRPEVCVKSHGLYAHFVATWCHWDSQKQEPTCKEMLGRRSCIRICLLFLSPNSFEFKVKFLEFCWNKQWCFSCHAPPFFFSPHVKVLWSFLGNAYRTCKQPYLKISVDLRFHYNMSQDWAIQNKKVQTMLAMSRIMFNLGFFSLFYSSSQASMSSWKN